jgi:hypothetical protein
MGKILPLNEDDETVTLHGQMEHNDKTVNNRFIWDRDERPLRESLHQLQHFTKYVVDSRFLQSSHDLRLKGGLGKGSEDDSSTIQVSCCSFEHEVSILTVSSIENSISLLSSGDEDMTVQGTYYPRMNCERKLKAGIKMAEFLADQRTLLSGRDDVSQETDNLNKSRADGNIESKLMAQIKVAEYLRGLI